MLKIINKYLSKQTSQQLILHSFLFVIVLVFIDHFIGPNISFTIFYIIPIVLATWYIGRSVGIYISLEVALIWFITDLSRTNSLSQVLTPLWNSIIRLSLFLIVILLLTKIKKRLNFEESLAATDSLTGLANSRSFYETIYIESIRADRYNHPFTIIYIDVDNFKSINDSEGHDAGDMVLKLIADKVKTFIRKTDTLARIGGDEFAGLFPETDYEAAKSMLKKIFSRLCETMNQNGYSITFSIGAASFDKPMKNVHEMVKAADELMYLVKKEGKNNIAHERWT
jgi:diguanylate cyclase (GGDEF)-like protein